MKIPTGLTLEGATFLRKKYDDLVSLVQHGPIGIMRYVGEVEMVLMSVDDYRRLTKQGPGDNM
jgi:PHD/YefM family antitoxin component YafN of YafNO toxin-antitoxin module